MIIVYNNKIIFELLSLLAGALTTCGVKPNYLSAATQAKKNFVRVVGGTEASGRWPWQVALVSKTTKEPFCGGTLIGREHVVSAAHCFDER